MDMGRVFEKGQLLCRSLYATFSAMFYRNSNTFQSLDYCYDYLSSIRCNARSSAIRNSIRNSYEPEFDITVVMTTYNRADLVDKCIESILSQRLEGKVEYILVNDGSSDDTAEVLDKYRDVESVTIVNQENTGVSGARNKGMDLARGKYICFVDDDDEMLEGALDKLWKITSIDDYDIIQGTYLDKNNRKVNVEEGPVVHPLGTLEGYPWGKLYKTSIFNDIEFPLGYWYEDSINAFLIYNDSIKAYIVNEPIMKYNSTENSQTSSVCNPKNLDSLYITEQLFQDRKDLNLPFDQENYEFFLRMVYLTYTRNRSFGNDIKYSIFQVERSLQKKYFKGFHSKTDGYLKKIEQALLYDDYVQFVRNCELRI